MTSNMNLMEEKDEIPQGHEKLLTRVDGGEEREML